MSEIRNSHLYDEVMGLVADGTLSHLRRLLKDYDGYVGRMSHWTGRYQRSDQHVPHEVGWLLGRLWVLFSHTQDQEFHDLALRILKPMIPDLTEKPITNLSAGCEIFFGLCLGAEITGSPALHDAAVKASKNVVSSLWSERLGRFRPWLTLPENEVPVEWGGMIYHLLWTSHAAPEHLDYFLRHHESVLKAGLIRPDGSTAHVAFVDDRGMAERYETFQGYSAESTWARGQSWAMHSFLTAADVSGRPEMRDASDRMNRWWLDRLPSDWVPFYDFDDPERDVRPRDPDAAAMAASALMRVNENPATASDDLTRAIDGTLAELCTNYVSVGGQVIHGSLGKVAPIFYGMETTRLPPGHANPKAVVARFPQGEMMVYGNYFLPEALHRRLSGAANFPSFLASGKFR